MENLRSYAPSYFFGGFFFKKNLWSKILYPIFLENGGVASSFSAGAACPREGAGTTKGVGTRGGGVF